MADLFHFVPGYKHYIYASGRELIFVLLLALKTAAEAISRLGPQRQKKLLKDLDLAVAQLTTMKATFGKRGSVDS